MEKIQTIFSPMGEKNLAPTPGGFILLVRMHSNRRWGLNGRCSLHFWTWSGMDYPVFYKTQVLNALESIDLGKIVQIIQLFKATRAHGRRIFVCGSGATDSVAAQLLCDMVKSTNSNRPSRLRILALSDRFPRTSGSRIESTNSRVFVEQLKNFAQPKDLVLGICTPGNEPNVLNAIDYANWIGCRTVAITGGEASEIARRAELAIQVSVTHAPSIEDVHMIICHMIGSYFEGFEACEQGA